MKIERVELAKLIPEDGLRISIPPDPGLHSDFLKKFPGIPPIVTDPGMVIISGYDSYDFMKWNGILESEVIIAELDRKEGLFHAINSRAVVKPLSLYEKINFLKIIIRYAEISEIYERVPLGIGVDEKLIGFLSELTGDTFKVLLSNDRISIKAAIRVCSFSEEDRRTLIDIFSKVRFSNSNELNFLDMVTEICFREKTDVKQVLNMIKADSLFQEKDPSAAFLSELSRLRYPAYTGYENEWKREIEKIKIPVRHSIHHSPFFEKKGIELRLFIDSIEKLKELSQKLRD